MKKIGKADGDRNIGKEKVSDFDFNKDEVEMDEVVVKPGGSTGGVGLTMSSFGSVPDLLIFKNTLVKPNKIKALQTNKPEKQERDICQHIKKRTLSQKVCK